MDEPGGPVRPQASVSNKQRKLNSKKENPC